MASESEVVPEAESVPGACFQGMCCPDCSEEDTLTFESLANLSTSKCMGCAAEFDLDEKVAELTENLAKWQKLRRWVALAETA